MAEKNIVYLLGAGASIGALPIVDEIRNRFLLFFLYISAEYIYTIRTEPNTTINRSGEFLESTLILIDRLYFKRSFDTVQKIDFLKNGNVENPNYNLTSKIFEVLILFEQSETDSDILKDIINNLGLRDDFVFENTDGYWNLFNIRIKNLQDSLSIEYPTKKERWNRFFELTKKDRELFKYLCRIHTKGKKKLDLRYENFLADILNSKKMFPSNIDILNWNYDSQFKLTKEELKLDDVNLREIKINGEANDGKLFTEKIMYEIGKRERSSIRFTWEPDGLEEINTWIDTKNANIRYSDLIVIGYSFPFSNKDVDQKIIDRIVKNCGINNDTDRTKYLNIHIQVPDPNEFEIIKQKIMNFLPSIELIKPNVKFHHQQDEKNFFIPNNVPFEY
ncbi:MAG: hypothetical protein QM526_00570 [Alphaproteobacteria bacterium]|nr:hypothetical protein [Alphaproteobacteria bacterium]